MTIEVRFAAEPPGFRERPEPLPGRSPGPHRDPFSRLLIARAPGRELAVVSNETSFDRYGVVRLW